MATYNTSTIEQEVLRLLDEHQINESLLDEDTYAYSLRELVGSRMLDAVKQVLARTPVLAISKSECTSFAPEDNQAEWGAPSLKTKYPKGEKTNFAKATGYVNLPEDFFRLISFKMSDWEVAAYELLAPTDEDYKMQKSDFKGIKGTKTNPMCVRVNDTLEFYPANCTFTFRTTNGKVSASINTKPTVSEALYLPYPSITKVKDEENNTVEGIAIPTRCYDSVVYTLAAMVCFALSNQQLGATFNELSKSSMV